MRPQGGVLRPEGKSRGLRTKLLCLLSSWPLLQAAAIPRKGSVGTFLKELHSCFTMSAVPLRHVAGEVAGHRGRAAARLPLLPQHDQELLQFWPLHMVRR